MFHIKYWYKSGYRIRFYHHNGFGMFEIKEEEQRLSAS